MATDSALARGPPDSCAVWAGLLRIVPCLPPVPLHQCRGGEPTSLPAASPMLCKWEPRGERGSWGVDPGLSLLCRGRLPSSRWEPRGRGFYNAVQEEVPGEGSSCPCCSVLSLTIRFVGASGLYRAVRIQPLLTYIPI